MNIEITFTPDAILARAGDAVATLLSIAVAHSCHLCDLLSVNGAV